MNLTYKFFVFLLLIYISTQQAFCSDKTKGIVHDTTETTVNNFQMRFMLRSEMNACFGSEHDKLGYANKPAMIAAGFDMGSNFSFYSMYRFDFPATIQKDGTPESLLSFNLQYKPNDNMKIVAGKQIMLHGSWEFEYNPIDVYYYSLMGNTVQGYVSGLAFHYNLRKNLLALQFSKVVDNDYLWNNSDRGWNGTLYYAGDFANGLYKPIWSYTYTYSGTDRSLHNIMFGNQFNIDRLKVEVDLMAQNSYRYYNNVQHNTDEYSAICRLEYLLPNDRMSIAAKYAFDRRRLSSTHEKVTEEQTYSMVFKYLISKSYNINIHSTMAYRVNDTPDRFRYIFSGRREKFFSLGLTWDFTTNPL